MALWRVAQSGATNVRFCSVDAVWSMEHLFAMGALAGLWTFFPDPWHKKRHHKRRLVTPGFAALAASRLAPGATWRLATDWADYAEQMAEVLDAEPLLSGWRRASLGRPAGDEVRAEGTRCRPEHHRPGVRAVVGDRAFRGSHARTSTTERVAEGRRHVSGIRGTGTRTENRIVR